MVALKQRGFKLKSKKENLRQDLRTEVLPAFRVTNPLIWIYPLAGALLFTLPNLLLCAFSALLSGCVRVYKPIGLLIAMQCFARMATKMGKVMLEIVAQNNKETICESILEFLPICILQDIFRNAVDVVTYFQGSASDTEIILRVFFKNL